MSFLDDDQAHDARTVYPDAATWLREWFAPRYRRAWTNGRVWCQVALEHDEAASRIDAMWQAWERRHEKDLAGWWLAVCDPMMAEMTSDTGPFAKCANGHSDRLAPLPGA